MKTDLPLVTIVTPTLNMGHFLEETIQSVLRQDYPKLEYIIIDGGSTDGTLDVLRKYQGQLQFYSAADGGTADAINRGFQKASGAILAYLNADDTYLPGAVSTGVRHLMKRPDIAGIYGNAYWVDIGGRTLGRYPTRDFQPSLLMQECFICQPASFVRREAIEAVNFLNADLRYAFDYDLWIRLAKKYSLRRVDEFLATSRMHEGNKTFSGRKPAFEETIRLLTMHFRYVSYPWVYSYCCYMIDKRDQFFQPLKPSLGKYWLSLLLGSRYNWRQPVRFWAEWAAGFHLGGLLRRWQAQSVGCFDRTPTPRARRAFSNHSPSKDAPLDERSTSSISGPSSPTHIT